MRASSSSLPPLLEVIEKGQRLEPDEEGAFHLWEQTRYVLKLSALADAEHQAEFQSLPRQLFEPLAPALGVLNFKNYVGHFYLLRHRFHIKSAKLSGDTFNAMLQDITRCLAALPFSFNSPIYLSYELNEELEAPILYHRWLLLSAWVEGTEAYDSLEGALGKIHYDPHRRMVLEPEEVPAERASRFSQNTLRSIATNPGSLMPVASDSRLGQTALAKRLQSPQGQRYFPSTIQTHRTIADLDTSENRFVKYVLQIAQGLNRRFRDEVASKPQCLNAELLPRTEAIESILSECLSLPLFDEVGDMRLVPSQSMVLQRRVGYRDFLLGYSRLESNLRFPISSQDMESILEAKDIAKLYEYWCYFQVAEALMELLGSPDDAIVIEPDAFEANMPRETRLTWTVEGAPLTLSYDRTFRARKPEGSYSVELRPDISLEWKGARYLFDAKFKLDGIRWEDDLPDVTGAGTTRDDLYKMHTYREAISNVVSALVLFPGTDGADSLFQLFEPSGGSFQGIGAIAHRPQADKAESSLTRFLASIIRKDRRR